LAASHFSSTLSEAANKKPAAAMEQEQPS